MEDKTNFSRRLQEPGLLSKITEPQSGWQRKVVESLHWRMVWSGEESPLETGLKWWRVSTGDWSDWPTHLYITTDLRHCMVAVVGEILAPWFKQLGNFLRTVYQPCVCIEVAERFCCWVSVWRCCVMQLWPPWFAQPGLSSVDLS